jgi:hypothetical protein
MRESLGCGERKIKKERKGPGWAEKRESEDGKIQG